MATAAGARPAACSLDVGLSRPAADRVPPRRCFPGHHHECFGHGPGGPCRRRGPPGAAAGPDRLGLSGRTRVLRDLSRAVPARGRVGRPARGVRHDPVRRPGRGGAGAAAEPAAPPVPAAPERDHRPDRRAPARTDRRRSPAGGRVPPYPVLRRPPGSGLADACGHGRPQRLGPGPHAAALPGHRHGRGAGRQPGHGPGTARGVAERDRGTSLCRAAPGLPRLRLRSRPRPGVHHRRRRGDAADGGRDRDLPEDQRRRLEASGPAQHPRWRNRRRSRCWRGRSSGRHGHEHRAQPGRRLARLRRHQPRHRLRLRRDPARAGAAAQVRGAVPPAAAVGDRRRGHLHRQLRDRRRLGDHHGAQPGRARHLHRRAGHPAWRSPATRCTATSPPLRPCSAPWRAACCPWASSRHSR